ncbi:MAG: heavy-metal-associated domain-containing protein [Ruminococcaceae bacterium]|nr:heavy-metal-associated domain-containing protein [Oscillospiraceae bacterium]
MVKIVANIEGMACGMCEAHMNEAVKEAFKVKKVTSSHEKKETVVLCEKAIGEEEFRAVVEKTGYKLISYSCEAYEKKGFSLFGKK